MLCSEGARFHIRKKNKTFIVETADNAVVQPVKLKDLQKHIYFIEMSNKTSKSCKTYIAGTGAGFVI